jgi:hypothetical protein
MNSELMLYLKILLISVCILSPLNNAAASDYNITGKVTDANGGVISNAKVSLIAGKTEFASVTRSDGTYSIRISGIYDKITGSLSLGSPFPVPFSNSVNIPFIINSTGDVRLTIYSLSGMKVKEVFFYNVDAGSYRISWDGCNQNGSSQHAGFYIYTVTFNGASKSGKLIKASGSSSYSAGTSLAPVMLPPVTPVPSGKVRIPVIAGVAFQDYYPVRLTDITIGRDTVINFDLVKKQYLPFKTSGNHIAMQTGTDYRSLLLKGINLGSSPPGYFPGEIAYAVTPDMYEKWINRMAVAGFNCVRVYTLHPPAFYEKLEEYNERNPKNPLLLFQGIWLEEVEDAGNPALYDLINRIPAFTNEIHEVINSLHGNNDIAYRYGKSYGRYLTDVSRWTAGYIIGREISPQEVLYTDANHNTLNAFTGTQFSITGGSATEVFVARMLDETVSYEAQVYSVRRPVSISSWPTLDPLKHPTEYATDEDKASFDITKINGKNLQAGLFACYHAYPYYPNFISQQPSYQSFSDNQGPDSYLGYITDLKNHYEGIPLVIGEFGVPSSWGSAHQSYSNMNHGGYSEQQQGEKDIRMLHNIVDAGCAGGFMFSWMDEWFKPTWIVSYLEAYGFLSGGAVIPTRQLWHNLTSPEQNFGLITFDEADRDPFISYQTDISSGPVQKVEATNDNSYFYLNILASEKISGGDTMMIAFDTYLKSIGESKLPNGKQLNNRSEFLLSMVFGNDTAFHNVTQAYNMNGLTLRFNLSDPSVQKYRSTVTDGAPWKVMQWINDGLSKTISNIGRVPMENTTDFTPGQRSAVAWSGNNIKVRLPWTMLYFYDPTQMKVIDGAVSHDGGYNFEILTAASDGIGLTLYYKGIVTSTTTRYSWLPWLIVPKTVEREKKSLQVIVSGLATFPGFAD